MTFRDTLNNFFDRAARWAKFRCDLYLLFGGMWRGECRAEAYDFRGRCVWVAAIDRSTADILGGHPIVRVFLERPAWTAAVFQGSEFQPAPASKKSNSRPR